MERRLAENLDIHPIRFLKNGEEIIRKHTEIGRTFVQQVLRRHVSYDGWSYVTSPIGTPIIDYDRPHYEQSMTVQKRPQYIDGQVILDFREAINSSPHYKPNFLYMKPISDRQSCSGTIDSPHALLQWSNSKGSNLLSVLTIL
jgi:hypothetical protein